jgi:hypothetical protein
MFLFISPLSMVLGVYSAFCQKTRVYLRTKKTD